VRRGRKVGEVKVSKKEKLDKKTAPNLQWAAT